MTPKKTLNVGGRLIDLSTPRVMGILNVTPDSFYATSRKGDAKQVLIAAEQMLYEGATFLDIGGYSSRPSAIDITEEEEIRRIIEPIESIATHFPEAIISIDTFRSGVAKAALEAGAHMINDISGGHLDQQMIPLAGSQSVPYIAMHMRGTPQTMKTLTEYDDLLQEMMRYFSDIQLRSKAEGIHDLIIDPGFGFSKTLEQNYYLLNHLSLLSQIGGPILVGVSRKSMIFKLLEVKAEEALNGTSVLNSVALLKGANILRVHDVREAMEVVKLITHLNDSGV